MDLWLVKTGSWKDSQIRGDNSESSRDVKACKAAVIENERDELGKDSWNASQKISNLVFRVYACRIWEDNDIRALKDFKHLFDITGCCPGQDIKESKYESSIFSVPGSKPRSPCIKSTVVKWTQTASNWEVGRPGFWANTATSYLCDIEQFLSVGPSFLTYDMHSKWLLWGLNELKYRIIELTSIIHKLLKFCWVLSRSCHILEFVPSL